MNNDTTQGREKTIYRIAEKAIDAYWSRNMVALNEAERECAALGVKREVDAIVKPALAMYRTPEQLLEMYRVLQKTSNGSLHGERSRELNHYISFNNASLVELLFSGKISDHNEWFDFVSRAAPYAHTSDERFAFDLFICMVRDRITEAPEHIQKVFNDIYGHIRDDR